MDSAEAPALPEGKTKRGHTTMNKKTLFVLIALAVIVLGSLTIIINSQLSRLADGFYFPDLELTDLDLDLDPPPASHNHTQPSTPGEPGITPPLTAGEKPDKSPTTPGLTTPISPEQQARMNEVQARIDKPISRKDMIKGGLIILSSLSREEINYIYEIGKKGHPSQEEMLKVREILINNLSPEDIGTLKELGAKYGKNLRILDPEVPIK